MKPDYHARHLIPATSTGFGIIAVPGALVV
jgi:hypothetical protein